MKKISEKIIQVPKGVQAEIQNNVITVKSGDKIVQKKFLANEIVIEKINETIRVKAKKEKKKTIAILNSTASLILNLFLGINKEFEYKLEVIYSHFPMNIVVKEGFVEINNLAGAKMLKKAKIVEGTKVVVKGKDILVTARNKEHAGQTAANIETATKIKGKDKRIFQDGIYIVSKPKTVLLKKEE